jgi:ribosomal protein S18 acetylase RimI-like enzyme
MDSDKVSFRKYAAEDLSRCAELAEQAWPMRGSPSPEPDKPRAFEPWIESSSKSATWTEVAVVSGEVVGFLFGSVDKMKPKGAALEEVTDLFWMFRQVLYGGLDHWERPLRTMLGFFFMEFKLEVNRPEADADIILLIVDARFRGRGIGKTLVDRFVKMAKDAGVHAVTLFTDDKISNWKFYEIYGFRKVNTFHDSISTYFAGERANAIYYILEFDRK